jgi:hypothetical protein
MAAALIEEALDSLERVGCQFWACEGPATEPVDMVTCHVCATVAKLRVAIGRPASDPAEMEA